MKQFPVLPPDSYTESGLAFIGPRVLELTYTAHDMQPWARDLGYNGEPFTFDPERRAYLRAELDAWYARAYGLTRDELRYILDPADVMGPDYPSETFRVLKNNELKQFGEFRTARLVMREFDRMALADEAKEPYASLLVPPPGQQVSPSYSPHGVLRDEDDARLAGLVILFIRAAGTLPRQQLTMALLIAQTPETGHTLLAVHEINQLDIFHRENSGMLTSGRLDRVQSLLRFFESAGAIRIEQQGTQITAVPNAAIPPGLIVDKKTEEIAGLLVRAAHMALQLQPPSDVVSDTQSFTKRA